MTRIQKEVVLSIKTKGPFDASRLIENTESMNKRIGENIELNERKIKKGKERLEREHTKID